MNDKFELELRAFVTEEQFRKAKRLCQIKGMSMSGLIRSLIAQEIFNHEFILSTQAAAIASAEPSNKLSGLTAGLGNTEL